MKDEIQKLTHTPLTYVLAQVKIGPILEMVNHITKLQEALRQDFPDYKEIKIQLATIQPNNDKPEIQSLTQWHCADKTCTTGVLIGNDFIVIHTSKYESFLNFIETIKTILSQCNEELKIGLLKRIGLRYINIISSNIEKSLKTSLLGFSIENNTNFHNTYLTNTETIQETNQGLLKIKTIYNNNMLKKQGDIFLPPDLSPSAELLSFEHHKRKLKVEKEWAILDLDHFTKKQGDFNVECVLEHIEKLHGDIKTGFRMAITEDAIKNWR